MNLALHKYMKSASWEMFNVICIIQTFSYIISPLEFLRVTFLGAVASSQSDICDSIEEISCD